MTCHGVEWNGAARFCYVGLVWSRLLWSDPVWSGLAILVVSGLVLYGQVWSGMVRYSQVWSGSVQHGTARYGTVRYGMACHYASVTYHIV